MTIIKKTSALFLAVLLAALTLGVASGPSADAAPITTDYVVAMSPGAEAECPIGSVEDGDGKCRKPVANTTACPQGSYGVPGACYIFVDPVVSKAGKKECRVGSVADNRGNCRKPVADVVVCPENTIGSPGGCYIFVPKVFPKVLTNTLAIK